ncbi:MAG: efflux RND transporter periplasmic adaptor subunit [Silicimonas sp.]|nr:efflux RND transporter periplasmic adaptor subunit [Silicimonas sp.]
MRVFSILTAIVVMTVLYFVVFEREALLDFAGAGPAAAATEADPEAEAEAEAETPRPASDAVSVVVYRSLAQSVDSSVKLRGRTEAARQVQLRAETSGQVISEPLRRGASVDAGDLLCRLDPGTRQIALDEATARVREAKARLPEAEARLAEARARLVEAEINGRAASRLSEDGFASETRVAQTNAAVEAARAGVQSANSGVEAAKSGIQAAETAVAAAENELGNLDIRAPFSGLLESDAAELGSLLQPGALCATIIQLNTIKLVGFVPETMVDRVTPGANARAELSSGMQVTGQVSFLSRSADPTTRTFQVDVDVANPDLKIRDGQTAEISIQSAGISAHILPQAALTLDDEGRLGVRLVVDDTAQFAPITTIRDTNQGIWVAGLPDQADVIVVGQEFVTDGVAVAATLAEARP